MKARVEQTSAVSGETSPLLDARTDLAKFQSGARKVFNMVVLPEGARTRRPGTRFVRAIKDETQPAAFVTFEAGGGDSYLLAFSGSVMQVYRGAGAIMSGPSPYELASPFPNADLGSLRWTQSIDTIFFAWNGAPQKLVRTTDTSWAFSAYAFDRGPVKLRNTNQAVTIQASADAGSIVLTASSALFEAGHVGSVWRLDEMNTGVIPVWKAAVPLSATHSRRWNGRIYDIVVAGDSGDFAPQHEEGDVQAGGATSGVGATFRFRCFDHGFVRIVSIASATSATAEVTQRLPPDVVTTPTYRWSEGAWCAKNGWPNVTAIVDQSLLWGRKNEIWLSETTDIYAFEEGKEEDSALTFRLFSPDGKSVNFQWAMNAGSLLLGATSSEWVIRGPSTYDRLTASTSRGFMQSAEGSAPHQPVSVAGGAVFIGRARNRLNFAKFDFISERIEIQEFTTFARHMLRGKARQLAWQQDPHRILWVLLDDGTLAAVTLRPDQEVVGWHRHAIAGAFVEAIACIQSTDGTQTELWLQTRRTIDGDTRRFIEVMQPFFEAVDPEAPTAEGAWFVECGLAYSGAATKVLTGFGHLVGETVRVVSPEGDLGLFEVAADGSVTIDREVTQCVAGLPIAWNTTTLPIDTQTQAGTTKGRRKTATKVLLHLHESGTARLSANKGASSEILLHGSRGFGDYELTTGLAEVPLDPVANLDLTLTIGGDGGLPFTLLGVLPDLDVRE